jgi:hypothetical protein
MFSYKNSLFYVFVSQAGTFLSIQQPLFFHRGRILVQVIGPTEVARGPQSLLGTGETMSPVLWYRGKTQAYVPGK